VGTRVTFRFQFSIVDYTTLMSHPVACPLHGHRRCCTLKPEGWQTACMYNERTLCWFYEFNNTRNINPEL